MSLLNQSGMKVRCIHKYGTNLIPALFTYRSNKLFMYTYKVTQHQLTVTFTSLVKCYLCCTLPYLPHHILYTNQD